MRVILASKSPRRREILASLGIAFEVMVSDAPENIPAGLVRPEDLVTSLATDKALAVQAQLAERGEWDEQTLIIAADTIVYQGEQVLGKPADAEDAKRMLRMLSDSEHSVYSGVCVMLGGNVCALAEQTRVFFSALRDEEIDWYVASGEPMDKAGAYAVQGLAAMWIDGIEGNYFNVVGLPVRSLQLLLGNLGVDMKALCVSPQ